MTKNEIARIQLERAMLIFTADDDMVSALTLAGAAEEILGKQVLPNAKDEILNFIEKRNVSKGDIFDRKAHGNNMNYPRNSLKHLRVGDRSDLQFDFTDEATALIDRAITNYVRLLGEWPCSKIYVAYCDKKRKIEESKRSRSPTT